MMQECNQQSIVIWDYLDATITILRNNINLIICLRDEHNNHLIPNKICVNVIAIIVFDGSVGANLKAFDLALGSFAISVFTIW